MAQTYCLATLMSTKLLLWFYSNQMAQSPTLLKHLPMDTTKRHRRLLQTHKTHEGWLNKVLGNLWCLCKGEDLVQRSMTWVKISLLLLNLSFNYQLYFSREHFWH